ncbi:site-specific integrase [Nannocystis exedens]|uniref:site-specific integrase n=1 Tax=Nannocystis exedens TaxID=54 RepID=UPI001FE278C2|nr:site-specific integrase [Nannocystis exedens]
MNEVKEVTAWPYRGQPNRWQVSMFLTHPITGKEVRVRKVAPADRTSKDAAILWGQHERLKIVTDLCRAPSASEREEEKLDHEPKSESKVPTLAEIWPRYVSEHVSDLKPASMDDHRVTWTHLQTLEHLPGVRLGDTRLTDIDGPALERAVAKLKNKGLALNTRKVHLARLRACLQWAVKQGLVQMAVAKIAWPKVKKVKKQVYSAPALEQFAATGRNEWETVFALLLTDLALRIGETCGLMWMDINFAAGTVEICRNVCRGILQDSAKGEDGTLELTPRLAAALQRIRRTGPFVLGDGDDFLTDSTAKHRARDMQRRAGLPVYGPHRIRHSVLTLLAEAGEDPYVLQAFARHADLATTLRYYVHTNKRKLAGRAATAVTRVLGTEHATPPTPRVPGNVQAARGKGRQIVPVA